MKKIRFSLLLSLIAASTLSGCSLIYGLNSSGSNTTGSTSTSITSTTTSTSTSEEPIETNVKSIEILPDSIAISIDETYQLNVNVLPETAINKDVTWTSSKTTIASIDENGLLKGLKAGTCVITARSVENSAIKATCAVRILSSVVRATSIVLDKTEVKLNLNSHKTDVLTATQFPNDATGSVAFKSFNTDVVTVDTSGKLTAKEYGKTTVRAYASSDSAVYADCEVTVDRIKVDTVSLDKHSLSVGTGAKPILTATVLPNDADDKIVYWESSDESIATVDNGEITTLKAGKVTIKVLSDEDPRIYDTCEIEVHDILATGLTLNPKTLTVSVNTSSKITPVFTPSDTSNQNVIWTSNNESVATVSDGLVTGHALGTALITAKSVDGGFIDTCAVTVTQIVKTKVDYTYDDFTENNLYTIDSIPNSGTAKVLVIPIWFNDSSTYLNSTNKARVKDDIEKAYFGTNADTGWRSVKTYYEEESFGKVTFDGTVTDWYECGYNSSGVKSSSITVKILKNAVSSFKSQNPTTFKDYDSNGDGYLDAVVMIYAAPDSQASSGSNDNLWAYCYWCQDEPGTSSNPVPNVFFWASYDFMYSSDDGVGSYYGGDTSHCILDTHTFIHEAGHMFGLEDYYDYNGGYEAAGAFTMQDYNVGGHDPFSKMALGWVDPYVVNSTITLEIDPIEESGDLIVLSPNFQNSPFDEYLIIDLYTPTGLNKFDSDYRYGGRYPQGPNIPGCRIWHVDNRLAQYNPSTGSIKLASSPAIVDGNYYTNAFTNSTFVSADDGRGSILAKTATDAYANYRQLQLIRKNYTKDYKCGDWFNANSLFVTGDTFNMTTYGKCFYNNGKLNSGATLGYSIKFVSVSSSGATITITKE